MLYNVLNLPAGVVRMTSVTEEDNDLMKHYPNHDMHHRRVKGVTALYSTCLFPLSLHLGITFKLLHQIATSIV